MNVESLSFVELPLIELVAPIEGVVVAEGSSSLVEPVSIGASLDVAVVVEDGKEVEANVDDVAVDCDLSCNIDEYRVDEDFIVDESGVVVD